MRTPSTFRVGELRVHALCDGISKVPGLQHGRVLAGEGRRYFR